MIGNDIVRLEYFDHVEVDLKDAKNDYSLYLKVADGKSVSHLVIAGKYTQMTTEAMKYIKDSNQSRSAFIKAEAIVVRSLAQRVLGNFYYRLLKPKNNVRMFGTEEEAIDWIHSLGNPATLMSESA